MTSETAWDLDSKSQTTSGIHSNYRYLFYGAPVGTIPSTWPPLLLYASSIPAIGSCCPLHPPTTYTIYVYALTYASPSFLAQSSQDSGVTGILHE